MPAVTFDRPVVERTNHLRYLGVHYDRMLTYRQHVETTVLRPMAAKDIEQRHIFLLYQSTVFNVIDYGLGITTMSQTNVLKLESSTDAN